MLAPLNSYGWMISTELTGEHRILQEILRRINLTGGMCCEFGAYDGQLDLNVPHLLHDPAWWGVLIEADPDRYRKACWHWRHNPRTLVVNRFVNCEPGSSLDDILDDLDVAEVDVVSIDVDSIDYWIWRGLRRQPQVVILEVNVQYDQTLAVTRPYEPQATWQSDDYYGATTAAMVAAGLEKPIPYRFVAHTPINIFLVRGDVCTSDLPALDPSSVVQYRVWPPGPPLQPVP